MEFEFDVEETRPESTGSSSNVDWDALNDYTYEMVTNGGRSEKQSLIGRITKLYELGEQERDDQVLKYDAKVKGEHAWRFEASEEKGKEGEQKDPTARIEVRKIKGKDEECLVYSQKPVRQMTMAIDFPEKMLDLGQFWGNDDGVEKPLREHIGGQWFRKLEDGSRVDVVGRPINLVHTNVNRQVKDAEPLYAFGKTSLVFKLANACDVLDETGNFKVQHINKLLGKFCMFEVNTYWNTWKRADGTEGRKLVTTILPTGRLSERDEAFVESDLLPRMDEDDLGGLVFKKPNRERDLKEVKALVKRTMGLALDYEGSKLQKELDELGNNKPKTVNNGGGAPKPTESKPVPTQSEPSKPVYNEPTMDFDDD